MAKGRSKGRSEPPPPPPPPPPPSPWILRGGLFLLIGFVVLALSDLFFAGLAVDSSLSVEVANQRYVAITAAYATGEILIGLGFFLVVFGYTRRRVHA